MSIPSPAVPKYRHYKPKNLGVVRIDGRDVYLGAYGSPESLAKYHRILAEWNLTGAPPAPQTTPEPPAESPLTVAELILRFWRHAERHYRTPNGQPSSELGNFRDTLRPLKKLFGDTSAREFSPLRLKVLRQSMVDSGLCRNSINQRIGRIVHIFKWGVGEELVPASVHQALKSVSGLQKGRTTARESEPVRPVPDADVEAIKLFVCRQVWSMIEIQRLSGMRPGEVVALRTCDLDTSGRVWVFTPPDHKMAYRGRERKIHIGPRGQAVLAPWLKPDDPNAFLFSPAEARADRFAALRARRKTKVPPSQRHRAKPDAKRRPGVKYTTRSYYHRIRDACKRAGVPPWHPNQLRHNAATHIRKEFGLDATRAILGHTSPVVSEVYAEMDADKACAIMGQIG